MHENGEFVIQFRDVSITDATADWMRRYLRRQHNPKAIRTEILAIHFSYIPDLNFILVNGSMSILFTGNTSYFILLYNIFSY